MDGDDLIPPPLYSVTRESYFDGLLRAMPRDRVVLTGVLATSIYNEGVQEATTIHYATDGPGVPPPPYSVLWFGASERLQQQGQVPMDTNIHDDTDDPGVQPPPHSCTGSASSSTDAGVSPHN